MTPQACRHRCLALPAASRDFPFGPDAEVFRVGGKMFALLLGECGPRPFVNLKCAPGLALELRAQYPEDVWPGYHMNKRHWNSVDLQGAVPDDEIEQLIRHSYELVVAGLPRDLRQSLALPGSEDG